MKQRPSSRLLIIDREQRLLLFRFSHKRGPLAGQTFWATPGGGLEAGESFADAARRELSEEVGLRRDNIGEEIAQRTAIFRDPDGEMIQADERYFLIRTDTDDVSNAQWTELEREVMAGHRWWPRDALRAATEQIWPEDIEAILVSAGLWTE